MNINLFIYKSEFIIKYSTYILIRVSYYKYEINQFLIHWFVNTFVNTFLVNNLYYNEVINEIIVFRSLHVKNVLPLSLFSFSLSQACNKMLHEPYTNQWRYSF